jgi:hypothetical protein
MTTAARKSRQQPAPRRRRVIDASNTEASPIEQLSAQLAEQAADIRDLRARVDAMSGPQRPPDNFLPLKRAAGLVGYSIETLRLRCLREAIGIRIGGRWYLDMEKLCSKSEKLGKGW